MASITTAEHYLAEARKLHPRLLAFFTRYPPASVAALSQNRTLRRAGRSALEPSSEQQTVSVAENTSSSDPNVAATTTTVEVSPSKNVAHHQLRNPFLPWKNPSNGTWRGPTYSLRRQAELFKLAEKQNVLSLMPRSPKHPEVKEQKRIEKGLRVQGTGVGKKVKGKLWERTLHSRLEKRRQAMEGMPALIKEWKERGHGRGWKKWPR